MLLITPSVLGQSIADPLADFLARYHRDPGEKVYRLTCDIDHDGNMDVFLAYSSNIEEDGDCGWTLYLQRGGAYINASALDENGDADYSQSPVFNIHRYVIGMIPELGKWGLLTSEVSTGQNGGTQLRAVIVQGNAFQMVDVGSFSPSMPTPTPSPGSTPTPSRFPSPPTPAIEELNP